MVLCVYTQAFSIKKLDFFLNFEIDRCRDTGTYGGCSKNSECFDLLLSKKLTA